MEKHRLLTVVLLAIQLLLIIAFTKELIDDVGLLAIILPILAIALFAGAFLRSKFVFILIFVWSVAVLIHGIILILLNYKIAYIIYIIFGAVQLWAVSQTRLK